VASLARPGQGHRRCAQEKKKRAPVKRAIRKREKYRPKPIKL
jgi:hypothetical protein